MIDIALAQNQELPEAEAFIAAYQSGYQKLLIFAFCLVLFSIIVSALIGLYGALALEQKKSQESQNKINDLLNQKTQLQKTPNQENLQSQIQEIETQLKIAQEQHLKNVEKFNQKREKLPFSIIAQIFASKFETL